MTSQQPTIPYPRTPGWITSMLWLAVALAAVIFAIRGPLRARSTYANDFAAPYISARLWLQHQNPYDPAAFFPAWHNAGAALTNPDGKPVYANPSSTRSVYPPPSIVVLSPFAQLPWRSAWATLLWISTLFYLGALSLLCRLIPGTWRQPRRPVFLVIGLLFAPVQSALHVSNVSALAAALALLAGYALLLPQSSPRPGDTSTATPSTALPALPAAAAAVPLALSIAIKPTLAPILLLFLLLTRRWAALTTSLSLIFVATLLFQFLQPNTLWLASLRTNISYLFTTGVANLSERNLTRSDRIDLQLPAYTFTHSRSAATSIAIAGTCTLLFLCYRAFSRQSLPAATRCELLLLSTLTVIGLLPFYQRFYSATLLLLPVLWALMTIHLPALRRHSVWTLALCSVFLINTSVLPRILGLHIRASGSVQRLFEIMVTPHLCWILAALALTLVHALTCTLDPEKIL